METTNASIMDRQALLEHASLSGDICENLDVLSTKLPGLN